MNKSMLFLSFVMTQLLMMACSENINYTDHFAGRAFSLELAVTSSITEVGNEHEGKERQIKSVFVYAFDDKYLNAPDFMADTNVKGGETGVYQLKMPMRDRGMKRFYFFVNPPENIQKELVPKCPEERLKSLSIYQNTPLDAVYTKGMPMSNSFEAYVDGHSNDSHTNGKADEVFLYPNKQKEPNKITEIPVFRSLGKITVLAFIKGESNQGGKANMQNKLAIEKIKIFNFNADGSALPIWDMSNSGNGYWASTSTGYTWNKDLKLDLNAMAKKEVMIINTILDVRVANSSPISSANRDNPDYITHCYLCQNSYGEKIPQGDDTQEGVEDVAGNRTSKMIIELNDGRVSEINLPYLRRNDNLKIRLAVNNFKIDADFALWEKSDVTPEWGEEISPNPKN